MYSDIQLWAGDSEIFQWPQSNISAFAYERINFLSLLSQKLLSGDYSAALKALGFWLREPQLHQWKYEYTHDTNVLLAPIGRVFIVSPSNVEGLFAYSWALSYLMGNQAVVRVSEQLTTDQKALFQLMRSIDETTGGLSRQAFISYDKRSEWTRNLSQWCQLRMLWGSDQSIDSIRHITLPAQSQEWVFPDRYSISVMRLTLEDIPKLSQLAQSFARDIGTYQQQACASPKWVFWYQTDNSLQQKFWQIVDAYLKDAFSENDRLVASQYLSALGGIEAYRGNFRVVNASGVIGNEQSLIGVVGQTAVSNIDDCSVSMPANLQAITVYGISAEERNRLAINSNVRKFVQIGQALNFDKVWDGTCLVSLLSRTIAI